MMNIHVAIIDYDINYVSTINTVYTIINVFSGSGLLVNMHAQRL